MKKLSFLVAGLLLGSQAVFAAPNPKVVCAKEYEQLLPFRSLIASKYGLKEIVKAADELVGQALASDPAILPLAVQAKSESKQANEILQSLNSYEKRNISQLTVQDLQTYQSLRSAYAKLANSNAAKDLEMKMVEAAAKVNHKSGYQFIAMNDGLGTQFVLTTGIKPAQQQSFMRSATGCGKFKVTPDSVALTWDPNVNVSTYQVEAFEEGQQCQDVKLGILSLLMSGSVDLGNCFDSVIKDLNSVKANFR